MTVEELSKRCKEYKECCECLYHEECAKFQEMVVDITPDGFLELLHTDLTK